MPELTAEELKAKKEAEEKASLLAKEKATQETLTNQQKDPVTKPGELTDAQKLRIYEIQQKTVREQGARLTATERELAELKAKADEVSKPSTEDEAKAFYANPRKVIMEVMEEVVAPLNVFKDRFENETEYTKIKRGLMANPVYAQHLNNPQFAAIVDELIAEGQRTTGNVNEGMVEAAIKHTIGSIVTGDVVLAAVPGSEVVTEKGKETKVEDQLIPPYLAPSSPPYKEKETVKQYRDLTENEARLARERGQTKEQYLDWLEVDPADVIDSKIGIPEKKKEGV